MNMDRRNFFGMTGVFGAAAGIAATLSACGGSNSSPTSSASAGSSSSAAAATNTDGTIKAGISYELGTNGYDPMTTTSALTLAANWHTMEGLTELHPVTRECYAALGKDLPTKVDDTTYEVTLRDGAVFSNGNPVTAADVVFSFERIMNPENKSLYLTFIPFIESVTAKDDTTVTIKTKYAYSLVAERLSVVKIVPQAVVEADPAAFDMNPVGTGAYIMTDNGASSQKVLFERNDAYTGPRPALAKAMEWQVLPESTTRTNALTSGAVQAIDAVPAADLATFKDPNKVAAVQGFGLIFAMFNCAGVMSDVRNRQAILYALDYAKICDNGLSGLATPATSFLQKEHPAYHEAKVSYSLDLEKAKALLAETGLTSIRLLATDHGWFSNVRPIIKENIEALGIQVAYEEKKSADVYGTIDSDPDAYDVVIAPGDPSVFGDDADLLLRWWYGADIWTDTRMHWKGQEAYTQMQELLERGAAAEGTEQQNIWKETFDLASETVPMYPLLHRKTPTAYNGQTLENFQPISLTGLSFVGVSSTT